MDRDTLTLIDNRTGKQYELPILYGTYPKHGAAIEAHRLQQIKVSEDDLGLLSYDPGYRATASCKSALTFVDGENGILRYRGYSIEALAEKADFIDVAYLLIYGGLPGPAACAAWAERVRAHAVPHKSIERFLEGFHYNSHTMGVLVGALGALSTFYPDARDVAHADDMDRPISRLMGILPTIAAFGHRHSRGLPCIYPDDSLGYCGNLLHMLFGQPGKSYCPHPVLERALNRLFILHADHEQNCSTSVMRCIGSALADPCSALAGAAAALHGPRHGGASEAALRMLTEIGCIDRVPEYIARVKRKEVRLQGFGHPVYRHYDPRAGIIKKTAHEIFEITGKNPLLDIALELERIALEDDYFVSRKLYPNVDFYSGVIYQAIGLPVDMMPVLFAIPRTAGWLAQWREMMCDPEQRIARPRQIYTGPGEQAFVPMDNR